MTPAPAVVVAVGDGVILLDALAVSWSQALWALVLGCIMGLTVPVEAITDGGTCSGPRLWILLLLAAIVALFSTILLYKTRTTCFQTFITLVRNCLIRFIYVL